MNIDFPVLCNNDQSTSEINTVLPHPNGEDENSVIIWYQNDNDESFSQLNISNNEDFIDIDMFSDWPEQEESNEDSEQNSPHEITDHESNLGYSTFSQDQVNNISFNNIHESQNSSILTNYQEGLVHDQNRFNDENKDVANQNLKDEDKRKLFDLKLKSGISLRNSENLSCYIDGLVSILVIFNRLDCNMDKFVQMVNECRCTPNLKRDEVTLSNYLLEASGAQCENCAMDFILDKLNSIFLKNIARAQFVPVQQIIDDSCSSKTRSTIGATNKSHVKCNPNKQPETGWLRKWMLNYLKDGVVAGIVYNDIIGNRYNCRPCNKVMFRLVTGFTDEEFQLTIPSENIKDEVLESRLLQEESICVLKSNILKCRHHHEDFQRILSQTDYRFNEMNVLGQIIGTFREKSSDSFRGFVPDEVHHIKIPNMHRNGVMLVINI